MQGLKRICTYRSDRNAMILSLIVLYSCSSCVFEYRINVSDLIDNIAETVSEFFYNGNLIFIT